MGEGSHQIQPTLNRELDSAYDLLGISSCTVTVAKEQESATETEPETTEKETTKASETAAESSSERRRQRGDRCVCDKTRGDRPAGDDGSTSGDRSSDHISKLGVKNTYGKAKSYDRNPTGLHLETGGASVQGGTAVSEFDQI